MQITNICEAENNLAKLIKKVQETLQPLILSKEGKPLAILSPFVEELSMQPRTLGGSWEGEVEIAEDFDEPDDDITEDFYNSTIFPDS